MGYYCYTCFSRYFKFQIIFLFFITPLVSFGQCAYSGSLTPVGTYTFCIDNSNTITTANAKAGEYVLVNVVKGFTYTFSVEDVFGGKENLTLFNAVNNSNFGATGYANGDTGASITNWTSSISGQIKVQLSRGSCNNNDNGISAPITLTLNNIGNTQDSQSAFGTDQWVGHVYNWTGGAPPGGNSPTTPSASNPFTNANYVGYYNENNEVINQNFGGDGACFPVKSAGLDRVNIHTETFAVRYRMRSTKTGYYFLNVIGDDGVRVYVDGTLVINEWKDQSIAEANFCNNLIYLNGTSNIVFDYYENGIKNEIKFSLTPFSPANLISGPAIRDVCSGTSPGTLVANAYAPCDPQTIPNVTYQWQVSTDNATWANTASGGTSKDYVVPVITTTTNSTLYYRRLVKSIGKNDTTNGGVVSNVITVNVNAPTVAGTISGATAICINSSTGPMKLTGYTGSVVRWEKRLLPSATWTPITNTTDTYSESLSVGGTWQYRALVGNGSCTNVYSSVREVTVNPTLSAPIIGTITQPTCSTATGSVVLSGLPTGSWVLTRTPGGVTTSGTGTSTTISGLAAGTTYTYSVNGLSNGLKGEYYNNITLSGSPVLTRTDATVAFNWANASPDPAINSDGFSVRWSGSVQPQYSETYTFSTLSDDGIRLWVNGMQIINNWTNHSPATNTGTIALTAGVKYSIVLEYYENTGDAVSQLSWSSPSRAIQIIPQSRLFSSSSCASPASANIVLNAQPATPAIPTGSASQSFCSSTLPTVANLSATGTAIKWYAASSGGSALSPTTTLVNGTHYYATQTVSGCESVTRFDVVVAITTAPSTPGTATPHSETCSGFTAQWGYAANAAGFYLDVATDSGFTNLVTGYTNLYVGNGSSYPITGLNAATTYYYRVRAYGCSTSANSGTMSISTSLVAVPGTATSYSPTCSGFTAQWGYAANATGFYLDVATDSGFSSIVSGYNNLDVGYNYTKDLSGLNAGTTYYYRVRAYGCGTSANSSTMTYATAAVPTVAPVATSVSNIECTAATLNWNSVTDATGYYIDIAIDSGFVNLVPGYNNLYIGYTNYYAQSLPGGTLYYRIRATNSCSITTTSSNTISFQTTTPSLSVGTITEPTCTVPTGSVVLSGLPTGNWTLHQSGTVSSTITGTGNTTTVSGLVAGTYTFTVNNGSCTSSGVNVAINTTVITTYYDGTNWSSTPDLNKIGIIQGSGTISVDTDLCSCTLDTGVNVVVNSGVTLKLQDKLTVNGSLTFENTASLVQINDAAANSGDIIYKRITPSLIETDYTYWSSPVSPQKLEISPDYTYGYFYSYNSSIDNWKGETKNTIMKEGVGYIIRGQKPDNTAYNITGIFKGVPNNGIKNVTVGASKGKSILLGNPYPSAINADAFLSLNSGVIEGTLYFWTHKTAIQDRNDIIIGGGTPGSGAYAYTSDDYASYNLTGGAGTGGIAAVSGGEIPTGNIAAGQGFFANIEASGTVVFNNDMRRIANDPIDNTQFFKLANTKSKTPNAIEKNRVWLNLTNDQGAFKQLLIGYITGASNDYDRAYDGISYNGNSFIDFYSINTNNPLTIQGRALPFQETDVVPLGYTSKISGAFTIAIDQTDGILNNQNIYLVDKLTNITQNLKEQAYTFTTNKGAFNDRFLVTYEIQNSLDVEDIVKINNAVIISQNERDIKIMSTSELINDVLIFDITGKLLLHKPKVNSLDLIITDFSVPQQMILVQVKLHNGQTINKKIIY